jgi:hypothetical protein
VMPDPDDIPLAEVAWQVSHSALWLREILAESQEIANRPTCSFITTSGANRYGQTPSTRRLARRIIAIEKERRATRAGSPSSSATATGISMELCGSREIAAACARVQNFIPGASA